MQINKNGKNNDNINGITDEDFYFPNKINLENEENSKNEQNSSNNDNI